MKKAVFTVLSLLLCAFMLTACGGGEAALNDTPLSDALTQINAEFFDSGADMKIIDSVDRLELYYDIAPEDVAEFAAETAANAATDVNEVVLIKAVDEAAAARIYDKLEIRYNSQRDLCASYSPELLAIVESSQVRTQGVLVSLIITEDFAEVSALCDEILFD